MVNLAKLGEFGLIDTIAIPDYAPEGVVVGRGDDCAVLPYDETCYQVVSCDLLIEDVHFIRGSITPQQLGYKAVAVNLSDVAAMGGRPVHILLSLALPPDYSVEEWQGFYQGVDEICRTYGVNVIGGDTTSSKDRLAINVTVIGLVEKQHLHLRSHARPGDVVFVTGALGGSRAGLEVILREIGADSGISLAGQDREHLLQCHLRPEPCCEEIAVLNRIAGSDLHALNDISDGILSECSEIAQASGAALILQPEHIPVDDSCRMLAEKLGADGRLWAMTGGEDYQLTGTMAPERAEEICREYEKATGKKISIIGFVEAGNGLYLLQNGTRLPAEQKGYNHFTAKPPEEEKHIEQTENTTVEKRRAVPEKLLEQVLQHLEEREEQHRIYRHDWNNHLACLSGLLECGEYKQAAAYLNEMIRAVPNAQQQYCSRTVVDILLQQKIRLAEEEQLDIQISCEEHLLDFMSDYDVCALLGNMLDNGLEHSKTGKERWLYLDIIRGRTGEVEIRMENSCDMAPKLQNGRLVTQKPEAHLHGKGMAQIERITESYNGESGWAYEEEQHRFITWCRFRNSP